MKRAVKYLMAGVLIVGFSTHQSRAQNLEQKPWFQEPTSFLGISFGVPIRASMAECPKITIYGSTRYDPGYIGQCFKAYPDSYEIDSISPFFDIIVIEIDGKVESIGAKFQNGNKVSLSPINANSLAATLVDKYGNADESKIEVVHNNAGAEYQNHILRWHGKNVTIEFDSVSGEYNHGYVGAFTATYATYLARKESQQQNSVKGVL